MLNTPLLGGVVLVVCAGLLIEAWLGYRATAEWQTSSSLLVARRAKDSIDVLMTALSRDMGGVQTTVLSSRDWNGRMTVPNMWPSEEFLAASGSGASTMTCFTGIASLPAIPAGASNSGSRCFRNHGSKDASYNASEDSL